MKRYRWLLLLVILLVLFTYVFHSKAIYDDYFFSYEEVAISNIHSIEEGAGVEVLRVMTYNIHLGRGMDDRMDLDRIAQVIHEANVDLVGLNEVDYFMPRTGLKNQIKVLGEKLQMHAYFAPALNLGLGKYGNGVLTQIPIYSPVVGKLPGFLNREQRGYAWFKTFFQGQEIQVLVTHLGLNPVERQEQLDYLAEKINQFKEPVIVMGDFNLTPSAPAMQDFIMQTNLKIHSNEPTYSSQQGEHKIDYIMTSIHWEAVGPVRPLESLASDHLPVVGDFRLKSLPKM